MAYRRPAIEVIQEFQEAAAALALPSLPACVVGPGYQIADDVNCGTYSEDDLAVTSYAYAGLVSGGIVDLDDAPTDEALANAHKSVGFKLEDVYLVKEPALPANSLTTGRLETPNLFKDLSTGAFASFDPDADDAPTYYVEVIGGTGVAEADKGRKLVISKTDDNTLVVAAEWTSTLPVTGVEYRILEFREEEEYDEDDFSTYGISKTATSVDVNPGLTSTDTTPLKVVEATVLLSWRALRPDLAGALNAFTDLDSLEAVFGVGAIVPANIGAYGVNLALLNTTTAVNFTGLGSGLFTNEEQAWQDALEYLEAKDVYGLAILTHNTSVHQTAKTHVESMSISTVGRERVCFFNRTLVELEVLVPASGIGTVTSAGTNNGLSGTLNKTFKDPTNGQFITDDVGTGHFLEITGYTAVEGVDRSVTPKERDFFLAGATDVLRIGNAAFVAGDVGKYILVRGATTVGNDLAYEISSIVSTVKAGVGTAPPSDEVMPSALRAYICDYDRTITIDVTPVTGDKVTVANNEWTFNNESFTAADIGRLIFVENMSNAGNNGVFTIASVESSTVIRTVEPPAADEGPGLGGTVAVKVYSIDREPTRDYTADSVVAASRIWNLINAVFTSEDVGRKIDIAGTASGNDGEYIIEAVLSGTQVRTDTSNLPTANEEFNGLAGSLTKLDIESIAPSTEEAAYITGTRHEIASVSSENQLVLVSDPTAGFGGTLEDVVYRITKDMTLNEQATYLAGYAASFASRRCVHTWPDILAVSVNSVATKIPGYFAGPILSGMTAGLPSQAGFTNLAVTGLVGREHSDDLFSDTQLDTIAGGGNMIFIQPVADAALSIRHQLTTDLTTIYYQEFSVTKNVDLIARFFRDLYAPFLGIYNITDGLLDLLKTRGEGGLSYLLDQRAPRVGAPIRSGQLTSIQESEILPDTVEIEIDVSVPLPLNNIKLTLLI